MLEAGQLNLHQEIADTLIMVYGFHHPHSYAQCDRLNDASELFFILCNELFVLHSVNISWRYSLQPNAQFNYIK